VIGLFGGAFDPPHLGHVALLRGAREELGLEEVVVVVAAAPGHKTVDTPAVVRLELARAAFPGETVVLDEHPRTIDMLRDHPEWEGAVFLLGADELAGFARWKEPEEVLRLVHLGVATRPGYALPPRVVPDRVTFFEIERFPISSTELRARLDRGEDVHELLPPAVWELIERDGLYGRGGYTDRA
jgi:nicotinate-nucleotide adenylyltransferase